MERLLTQDLLSWKKNRNKKPLVLFGARQTGKTYLITEFGKNYYSNIVYFNFEGSPQLADIFKKDLNPARILNELSAFSGSSILKGKTLIFFDEIQACAQALTSLKYFCEWTEQYDIIAAGSLLGIVLNRKNYSFPVGKVDLLSLYPLNFKEFLLATKNEKLIDMIATAFENDAPLSEPLHEKALDLYRIYLIVGGMPADVNEYLERKDFDYVRITQNAIYQNYIADMAKYSTPADTVKTIAVYDSIPAQLAKENKKFQYRLIKSGARASTYESAMDWLKKAGIIISCNKVTEGQVSLDYYKDLSSYKIYLSDVGLLTGKSNLPPSLIQADSSIGSGIKGALTENYVAQELVAKGHIPFYWESNGKAELDFVIQRGEEILAIECKSGENTKAKSLNLFLKKYNLPYGIRISTKNFGFANQVKSVPLYAVFCI